MLLLLLAMLLSWVGSLPLLLMPLLLATLLQWVLLQWSLRLALLALLALLRVQPPGLCWWMARARGHHVG